MMPSARLDQGSFKDYDLLLASNFARAAEKNSLEQVVYVGGIIPDEKDLSPHLSSRKEVEKIFKYKNFSYTNLRAGLILGSKGSSFQILKELVVKLPVILCPNWTKNEMTPIYIGDVVRILKEVLTNKEHLNQRYEIGGSTTLTYYDLLKVFSKKLKKKRIFIRIPFSCLWLSKVFVSLFTKQSKKLVYPLLDSLKSSMALCKEKKFVGKFKPLSYEEALEVIFSENIDFSHREKKSERKRLTRQYVRSVQRMKLSKGKTAKWAAEEYTNWLPKFLSPLLLVSVGETRIQFSLIRKKWVMLELTYSNARSEESRRLFYITGGALVRVHNKGRLEFRETLGGRYLLVAIHDFYPALPWYIYRYTQALVHLWVMKNFAKHIRK